MLLKCDHGNNTCAGCFHKDLHEGCQDEAGRRRWQISNGRACSSAFKIDMKGARCKTEEEADDINIERLITNRGW